MAIRRIPVPLMVLHVGLLALVQGVGIADDVPLGGPIAERFQRDQIRFASMQGVLLAFRHSQDRGEPAVVWTTADGRANGSIYPLKDFPNAERLDVWDTTSSPQGILIAGVVQSGERRLHRPPRHVLLTYDLTGALRRLWQVNPYHHHRMAADHRGNVYALGHRIDKQPVASVIVKYAPDGTVDREFLSSDLLPGGQRAVISDGRSGENQMWIDGERLLVYLAKPQELFQFDLDGRLQTRTPLRHALAQLTSNYGGTQAAVMTMVADEQSATVLAHVRIWGDKEATFALARLPLDGTGPVVAKPARGVELDGGQVALLGKSGHSTLFLNRHSSTILHR